MLSVWDLDQSSGDIFYLPKMESDICLRAKDRKVIIDTKFNKRIVDINRVGNEKIKSENLLQLFAYLENLERCDPPDNSAEGILLSASVGEPGDLITHLDKVRIYALNLNREGQQIHADLLDLLKPWELLANTAA